MAAKKIVKSSPKSEVESAPEVVSTPEVETAVVTDVAAPEVDQVDQKFQSLYAKITTLTNALKDMTLTVKVLQKEYVKSVKSVTKRGRKGVTTKRNPSGFAKPAKLSDELCDFLSLPRGSQEARTNVTRMINEYIKKNNLQDSKDKRNIIADAALKKIMNLQEGDVLSYFNLQKYIKHHFVTAKN